MKTIKLFLAALACLQVVALAAPDSIVTGPYKVSFDMGLNQNDYNVIIASPIESEAIAGYKTIGYGIEITSLTDPGYSAIINISYDESGIEAPTGDIAAQTLTNIDTAIGATVTQSARRIIDGDDKHGAIISGYINGAQFYHAQYAPVFAPTSLLVSILSTYPWEPNTLNLLKTIHIEQYLQTAKDTEKQKEDFRPASGTVLNDFYRGGSGVLNISNGLSKDAMVLLTRNSDNQIMRAYVRAGDKFNISSISDGIYQLFYTIGDNWDENRQDFTTNQEFYRFDDPLEFKTLISGTESTYTIMEVTLHEVLGGNARTIPLDRDVFPKIN